MFCLFTFKLFSFGDVKFMKENSPDDGIKANFNHKSGLSLALMRLHALDAVK